MRKKMGEKIVDLLCKGMNQREVAEQIGLTTYKFREILRRIQRDAGLPQNTSTYPALKDSIAENMSKWRDYREYMHKVEREYRDALVKFE